MKVLNETTNEIIELPNLIDPKTGMNWVNDYVGNAISREFYANSEICEKYDYEVSYAMPQEELDFWVEQINKMQEADELLHSCSQEDTFDFDDFYNYINGYEFNDVPNAIIDFCNELKGE